MQHLYCWVSMRRLLQESFILQENVKGFETKVISDLLGDLYHLHVTIADPVDHGWPISRVRKFTILRHKLKTGPMTVPLNVFSKYFQRPMPPYDPNHPAFDMFFIAEQSELMTELLWSMNRPCSEWDQLDEGDAIDLLDSTSSGAYWKSLTSTEKSFLDRYLELFPGVAYSLNQNPDFGATKSGHQSLQTLIKNTGILWILA